MKRSVYGNKYGFTLVELLVVISVIALLLAILMPALNKVRGQAAGIVSMNNMRQLMVSHKLYEESNRGLWPASAAGHGAEYSIYESPGHTSESWVPATWVSPTLGKDFDVSRGALFPYVKDKKVYVCPTDKRADPALAKDARLSYAINERIYTYRYSVQRSPYPRNPYEFFPKPAKFKTPGRFIVMVDNGETNPNTGANDGWFAPIAGPAITQASKDQVHWKHGGASPFGFGDTHCEKRKESDKQINEWPLNNIWSPGVGRLSISYSPSE